MKLAKIKGDDGQQHDFILTSRQGIDDGKPFYAVNVESSLIDFSGRFDNVKVTEYWVKSLIDAKKGTSQMTTLCVKAGSPPPARATQKDRLDHFLKVLSGEPEVIVETYWEARCQACEQAADKRGERKPNAFLRGEQRFPMKTGTSAHDPNATCPVCRGGCRAQLRVAQYYSLTETKATRGTGVADEFPVVHNGGASGGPSPLTPPSMDVKPAANKFRGGPRPPPERRPPAAFPPS